MKNARVWMVLVSFLAAVSAPAFSQNVSIDLFDPTTLGSLGSGASAGALSGVAGAPGSSTFSVAVSPGASALNPAAAGWLERTTIDVSYLGLAGLGATTGWGNLVNLGASFPTPYGVITTSARYLGSTFPTLNVGNMGSLNLAFAKDVYHDLSVGAGLGFQIGQDWGLGLDLGFVHAPGDLAFLKNFRWGAAFRGIGKGYTTTSTTPGEATVPPWFTPDIGTSFDLVATVPFTLSLASDLSFPAFSDVRYSLGLGIAVLNVVTVQASYTFDLDDTLGKAANSFPFGFGVFATIPVTGAGDLAVTTAAAPLTSGVWGFGLGGTYSVGKIDRAGPAITLASQEDAYISPGTQSSDQVLSVPLTVAGNRYLKGYRLIIYDGTGKAIRTIETADQGPQSTGIKNFFDRLFSKKASIPVPQALSWDGKDDSGKQVPDGTYTYAVEAWDDNGNLARIDPKVVVDTVAPQATVSAPLPGVLADRGRHTREPLHRAVRLFRGSVGRYDLRRFRRRGPPVPLDQPGASELHLAGQGQQRQAPAGRDVHVQAHQHRSGRQHRDGDAGGHRHQYPVHAHRPDHRSARVLSQRGRDQGRHAPGAHGQGEGRHRALDPRRDGPWRLREAAVHRERPWPPPPSRSTARTTRERRSRRACTAPP